MKAKTFTEFIVTVGMEWRLMPNLMAPGGINTELDRLGIEPHSVIKNRRSISQFDFGSYHHFHKRITNMVRLFKERETIVQMNLKTAPTIPATAEAVNPLRYLI